MCMIIKDDPISYYRIIYSIFSNHNNTVPLITVTLITYNEELNILLMITNQGLITQKPKIHQAHIFASTFK